MNHMSFDLFTLSIVVSGLSILGAITMYSQQHILFDHPSLGRWVLGGMLGSLGFVAMLFYTQLDEWAIFLHTAGSLLSFYYLYLGVRVIDGHQETGVRATRTDVLMVAGYLVISWLLRDNVEARYVFHDAVAVGLCLFTIHYLWKHSIKGELWEYTVALIAYISITVAFAGRFVLAVLGHFSVSADHPYNDVLFLIVIFWVCGWVFGLSLILHKQRQRMFEEQLMRDELTGLLNRNGIMKVAGDWIENGTPFHLYVLDLNGFKQVNDTFGHMKGDQALQTYSKLARDNLPHVAKIGRIGGDEFVILSPYPLDFKKATLKYELSIGDVPVTLDASIGEAVYPTDGDSVETLFLFADDAMYIQKYS